jgi:hypothetical protein
MLKTVSSIVNAIGALNYKGTWNASTNTPTLASSVGVKGDYYVVSVAGSTTLNGISNWGVGDWVVFNGSAWQRVEGGADLNGVNLSVSGTSTLSGLTASTALALDASKNVVSVTNTGTGNNVLGTSPTLATPTLSSGSAAGVVYLDGSKIAQAGANLVFDGTNFGIGEATPSTFGKCVVKNGTINLVTDTPTSRRVSFWSQSNGNSENAYIQVQNDGGTTNTGEILFATKNAGGTLAERMRLDATGNGFAATDNAYTWGANGKRWSAIWAVNGTIQTSDLRTKTEVSDAVLGYDFIKSLRPVSYKWVVGGNEVTHEDDGIEIVEMRPAILDKDGNEIEPAIKVERQKQKIVVTSKPGVRTHWGFIAQEVKDAVDAAGVDFGGWVLTDKENPDSEQALRYDQFISPMVKALQEAMSRIEKLEAEIAKLKG